MSDLEIIEEAFNKVGIKRVVRSEDRENSCLYLFMCNDKNYQRFEAADLEFLCKTNKFMEFTPDGGLISY